MSKNLLFFFCRLLFSKLKKYLIEKTKKINLTNPNAREVEFNGLLEKNKLNKSIIQIQINE